jgi:hypothetical protein
LGEVDWVLESLPDWELELEFEEEDEVPFNFSRPKVSSATWSPVCAFAGDSLLSAPTADLGIIVAPSEAPRMASANLRSDDEICFF